MKKNLDINKIHELTLALKKIVLNEPTDETLVAVDRFIQFFRNRDNWQKESDK